MKSKGKRSHWLSRISETSKMKIFRRAENLNSVKRMLENTKAQKKGMAKKKIRQNIEDRMKLSTARPGKPKYDVSDKERRTTETQHCRSLSLTFFHEFKFNFRVPFLTFGLVSFPNTSSFFPHLTPSPLNPIHTSHVFLPTILPYHILYGIGLLPSLH